ncbi:MAG: protein CysJ [Rickettsiales bacterium]|nr:protein CysJ [Rickettsiales bacterium]
MTENKKSVFNRKNPLSAKVTKKELLTHNIKEKQTWHIEIDLVKSGMDFTPGDSLAIFPENNNNLVNEILHKLQLSGNEIVINPNKEKIPLKEALLKSYSITIPDKKLLNAIAEKANNETLKNLLLPENKTQLNDYLWGREVIDFLLENPSANFTAEEFVSFLKKLNVRLYSIASSLRSTPNQVDLTVAVVEYESHNRLRKGVCSSWLAETTNIDTTLNCFITPGKSFRLPEPEDDTPIIMCGPGTGIAPFRAFLQERKATNAKGECWLIFGEIHEEGCFFYKNEWEDYLADGTLNKLSTAWSRDQKEKIYVQNKIIEEGEQFWSYLEKGAIFYVCGDAERMAPDVDAAIHQIIQKHGNKSENEAIEYVNDLKANKRYRKDVY